MLFALVLCALLAAPALAQAERASRLVQTAQGPVRGYGEDGLFAFYGIPYATAPTGPNKFKPSTAGPIWKEPFEAIDKGIICPQARLKMDGVTFPENQEEDCLLANIYVPDTNESNLPVVVIVHGGGYQGGYGKMIGPKSLVRSKKIIAVSFNYRLGAHGFLCLGTEDAPGNAGMKDQVALLRWVKRNIANFGGNPNDVTITGSSGGSSAVDLLQLSKTTDGLINKVIPESGANVGVWSVQLDPLQNAKDYAKKSNFTNVDDIYALEQFYKTLPLKELFSDTFGNRKDSNFVFTPCVERDIGEERFLTDTPVNILRGGQYKKLPMLYGFAKVEGLYRLTALDLWKHDMNEKFSDFLPADLQFSSEEEKEVVANKIKEFYFGDESIGDKNTITGYVDYFGDVMFAYPTLRSVRLQVEAGNNKVFLYEYSFIAEEPGPLSYLSEKYDVRGADHSAQTFAVYEAELFGVTDECSFSERTRNMRAKMRELWLNFITTGTPVLAGCEYPPWLPAGADGGPHMSLDERLALRGPLLARRARFWDGVYARHYRQPVPPPAPPQKHAEL